MLLMSRRDVGAAAFARMCRDGVLTTLTDDVGVAPGPVPLHIARAFALAPYVPRKGAATGLAALWCYGLTRATVLPAHVEVVVRRGAHPDPPAGVPRFRWTFTTDQAAYARARIVAGVRIVAPADAVASALRTAPLAPAMVAAYAAAATGIATAEDLYTAVCQQKSSACGTRAFNAWQAVQGALQGR